LGRWEEWGGNQKVNNNRPNGGRPSVQKEGYSRLQGEERGDGYLSLILQPEAEVCQIHIEPTERYYLASLERATA